MTLLVCLAKLGLSGRPISRCRITNPSATTRDDDKHALFVRVLGRLKDRNSYFTFESIRAGVKGEGLRLKKSSLKVYLNAALKHGIVHDAGRGWYSGLSETMPLDSKPLAKLIRHVEKAFPLLEFTVWSTAQINPWMHHLLAHPVAFLHAPGESLESVGDGLRERRWEIVVSPTPTEGPSVVRPGELTVVLRPSHSKQPTGEGRQASIEKILVDLLMEAERLALMDASEAQAVVSRILGRYLVRVATLQRYAKFRGVERTLAKAINQCQKQPESGVS